MQRHREALDLIQKKSSLVRPLELSYPALARAGKGTGLMAEHLAFEELFRNSPAVNGHESRVAPARLLMQTARDKFLAGAGFADHYDVRRCVGKVKNRVTDLRHLWRSAQQRGFDTDPVPQPTAQGVHLECQPALLGRTTYDFHQMFGSKRLLDQVVGTITHRLYRHRDVAGASDEDHR